MSVTKTNEFARRRRDFIAEKTGLLPDINLQCIHLRLFEKKDYIAWNKSNGFDDLTLDNALVSSCDENNIHIYAMCQWSHLRYEADVTVVVDCIIVTRVQGK